MSCPCSRPTTAWLCPTCMKGFKADLGKVPGLLGDLAVTAAKLDNTGVSTETNGGGEGGSRPPVNLTATMLTLDLEVMLRAMWAHTGHSVWLPNMKVIVAGILEHLPRLAAMQSVISYRDQLTTTITRSIEIIDLPKMLIRLGDCPTPDCCTPLTALDGHHEVRCLTCGEEYEIQDLRRGQKVRAVQAMKYSTGTAAQVSRILKALGLPVSPDRIRKWVEGEKLESVGVNDAGRATYSVDDVMAVYSGYGEKYDKSKQPCP